MEGNKTWRDSFLRVVALLGLILVLLLGAWGIILLSFNLSSIVANVGTSIGSLFAGSHSVADSDTTSENSSDTDNTPVATPSQPVATSKPTTPSNNSQGTYVPASRTASLYGYPDLVVRVLSVNSLSSVQGRSVVQFEVANAGTNMAPAGWSFDASLPTTPAYNYHAPLQQALYPGDKIVFTLTFDNNQQYSYGYNNSYDNRYSNDKRYTECGENHNRWDEQDWQNWYEDTWNTSSRSRDNWDTNDWENWYDNFCGDYSYNNYSNSYYQYPQYNTNRTATIVVDPSNYVRETNEANNTISVRTN